MAHLIRMPRAAWRRQPQGAVDLDARWDANGVKNWTLPTQFGPGFVSSSVGLRPVTQGLALDFNDTNIYQRFTDRLDYSRGEVSGFVFIDPLVAYAFSGQQGFGTYFSTRTFGNHGWSFSDAYLRASAPGNEVSEIKFTIQGVADYPVTLPNGTLPALLGPRTVGFRAKSGAPLDFFVDGIKYARSGNIGTVVAGDAFIVGKQGPFDSTLNFYGQPMLLAVVADRFWDESAFTQLHQNPWQLFRPAPTRFILIPSAGGGSYNMTSVVASASSTATAAVNLLRAFQSTVASLSATSAPSLSNLVSLLSPILSLSGTASSTLTISRTLDSAANSISSTNDAAIQIHRALQSAITGTSSTPDTVTLSVAGFIALLSTVASQSSVATPNIIIQRDMASAVASASSTSTAALQIQRDLLSSLNSTSATATVTLNTTTIIALASAVSSGSLTPNAACTIARALSSVVASTSSTADSAVDVQRNLLTSVASQSETSIALLEALNLIALAGAINSQSSTATPTLDVARALVSDVLSASVTATITPAVLRELATALVSASVTGDADLALAVLGQVELISSIASTSLTNDKARLLQDLVAAIQTEMTLTLSAERPSIQMTDTRPSIILH